MIHLLPSWYTWYSQVKKMNFILSTNTQTPHTHRVGYPDPPSLLFRLCFGKGCYQDLWWIKDYWRIHHNSRRFLVEHQKSLDGGKFLVFNSLWFQCQRFLVSKVYGVSKIFSGCYQIAPKIFNIVFKDFRGYAWHHKSWNQKSWEQWRSASYFVNMRSGVNFLFISSFLNHYLDTTQFMNCYFRYN